LADVDDALRRRWCSATLAETQTGRLVRPAGWAGAEPQGEGRGPLLLEAVITHLPGHRRRQAPGDEIAEKSQQGLVAIRREVGQSSSGGPAPWDPSGRGGRLDLGSLT